MDKEIKCGRIKEFRQHFAGSVRTMQTNIRNHGVVIFLICWVPLTGFFGCAALKEVREMESVTGPCKVECHEEAMEHADCLGYSAGLAASGAGGGACFDTRARYAECMKKCTRENPPD